MESGAWGFGVLVSGSGFQVSGFGLQVSGFRFRVSGFGFWVSGAGCRVQGAGCRVQSAKCRVQDAGGRGQGAGLRPPSVKALVNDLVVLAPQAHCHAISKVNLMLTPQKIWCQEKKIQQRLTVHRKLSFWYKCGHATPQNLGSNGDERGDRHASRQTSLVQLAYL